MWTTLKRGVMSSIILGMVLFLFVGCGAAPVPTVDQAALEATITAKVIATQTASAPTAIPTATAIPPLPPATIPNGWRVANMPVVPFTFAYPPEWGEPFEIAGGVQFQARLVLVLVGRSTRFDQWPSGTLEEAGAFIAERYLASATPDRPFSLVDQQAYRDDVRMGFELEVRGKGPIGDSISRIIYFRLRDGRVFAFSYERDDASLTDAQRETLRSAVSTIRENTSVPVALQLQPTPGAVGLATSTARPTRTSTPAVTSTPAPTSTPLPTSTPVILSRIPPKKNYQHNYTVEVKYDNIRDSTSVVMTAPFAALNRMPNSIFAVYAVAGNKVTVPEDVFLRFSSTSDSWQFLGVSSIDWLIDGNKRYSLKATHDGTVGSGYVIEYLGGTIPLTQFLDIANADKVEVAISYVRFSLSPQQLEALKDFASRMRP